jgi:hypothetical protein
MLSAIIAAVVAKKKIRKSPFENEVKARCLGKGERGALVSEFNCLRCLVGVDVDADCSPDSATTAISSVLRVKIDRGMV